MLSIGGLVKHVAATERHWIDMVLQRRRDQSQEDRAMYELMAAAEGWPATDWLTPWTPPSV